MDNKRYVSDDMEIMKLETSMKDVSDGRDLLVRDTRKKIKPFYGYCRRVKCYMTFAW